MDLRFGNRRLRDLCNSRAALVRRWGAERAEAVAQCLQELDALDRLGDLQHLPHVSAEADGPGRALVHVDGVLALVLAWERRRNSGDSWGDVTEATIIDVLTDGEDKE